MAILVTEETRLLVVGISGRYARGQVREMLAYGGRVVAGVAVGRGGEIIEGVPVFDTVMEVVAERHADAALLYVPAPAARDAAVEALEAGIRLLVVITEGVPVHDAAYIRALAEERGAWVVGPNTAGLISPGRCLAGSIAPAYTMPGPLGVISRSGTLAFEVARSLTEAGIGQSTVVAIGGDVVVGKNPAAYLEAFAADPETRAIVLLGEVGGRKEHEAAAYIARMTKPVVALIVGRSVPPGKQMGHAGALIAREEHGADAKREALRRAGALVADTLWDVPELAARALSGRRA
jgi:succinyl-CoA synthetase alpha subunit